MKERGCYLLRYLSAKILEERFFVFDTGRRNGAPPWRCFARSERRRERTLNPSVRLDRE